MSIIVNCVNFIIDYIAYNWWLLIPITSFICIKIYNAYTRSFVPSIGNISGKTVIITGAEKGIGFETARSLIKRNARVIIASRSLGLGNQAKAKIIQETGNENIEAYALDLSSLWSIRQFVKEIKEREGKVDILINNAGVNGLRNKKTSDDLQIMWQINHFGPFLLTNLLLGMLKKSAPSRIIFVSSIAHHFHNLDVEDLDCHKPFNLWRTYCNTKLANILTANYLARKLQGTGVTVNSLHPGLVDTDIHKNHHPIIKKIVKLLVLIFGKPIEDAAASSVFLAVDPHLEGVTGKYFSNCKVSRCLASVTDDVKLAEQLWQKSEELVDLKDYEKHVL